MNWIGQKTTKETLRHRRRRRFALLAVILPLLLAVGQTQQLSVSCFSLVFILLDICQWEQRSSAEFYRKRKISRHVSGHMTSWFIWVYTHRYTDSNYGFFFFFEPTIPVAWKNYVCVWEVKPDNNNNKKRDSYKFVWTRPERCFVRFLSRMVELTLQLLSKFFTRDVAHLCLVSSCFNP